MNENKTENRDKEPEADEKKSEAYSDIEEIVIEELAVDGICGIY